MNAPKKMTNYFPNKLAGVRTAKYLRIGWLAIYRPPQNAILAIQAWGNVSFGDDLPHVKTASNNQSLNIYILG